MNNIYFDNLLIHYFINKHTQNKPNLQNSPIYIYFKNCKLNIVPETLSNKYDIGIVIENQFEDLKISYRTLNVILYFNSEPYNVSIDLSTIYNISAKGKTEIDLEYRKHKDYIENIENIPDTSYSENMNMEILELNTKQNHSKINNIQKSIDQKNKKKDNNIFIIEEIINK